MYPTIVLRLYYDCCPSCHQDWLTELYLEERPSMKHYAWPIKLQHFHKGVWELTACLHTTLHTSPRVNRLRTGWEEHSPMSIPKGSKSCSKSLSLVPGGSLKGREEKDSLITINLRAGPPTIIMIAHTGSILRQTTYMFFFIALQISVQAHLFMLISYRPS